MLRKEVGANQPFEQLSIAACHPRELMQPAPNMIPLVVLILLALREPGEHEGEHPVPAKLDSVRHLLCQLLVQALGNSTKPCIKRRAAVSASGGPAHSLCDVSGARAGAYFHLIFWVSRSSAKTLG
jgi:hypothetical protein